MAQDPARTLGWISLVLSGQMLILYYLIDSRPVRYGVLSLVVSLVLASPPEYRLPVLVLVLAGLLAGIRRRKASKNPLDRVFEASPGLMIMALAGIASLRTRMIPYLPTLFSMYPALGQRLRSNPFGTLELLAKSSKYHFELINLMNADASNLGSVVDAAWERVSGQAARRLQLLVVITAAIFLVLTLFGTIAVSVVGTFLSVLR